MDLDALLAELAKLPTDKVIEAIKAKYRTTLYQPIFNDGHSVATGTHKADLAEKERLLTDTKTAKDAAERALQEFKDKNPSQAELHQQYGVKLTEKEREIETLKTARQKDQQDWRHRQTVSRIRTKLGAIIDSDKADAITETEAFRNRVVVEGDTVRIMQSGSQIPFSGDESSQIDALVEEVKKAVPAKFVLSQVKDGTGSANGTNGDGTPGSKAFYDAIRESVKKPAESTTGGESALAKRMGMRIPAA